MNVEELKELFVSANNTFIASAFSVPGLVARKWHAAVDFNQILRGGFVTVWEFPFILYQYIGMCFCT